MTNKIFEKNLYKVSGFRAFPDSWRPVSINQIFNLGRGRVISQEEIQSNKGVFPVYSSQTSNNGIMGFIDSYDFDTELITWTTDGANAGTVFKREGKFNCTNVCGTLRPKSSDKTDLTFFKYHLGRISKNYVSYIGNPKLMNDVMGRIALPIPDVTHQRKIAKILSIADAVIAKTEAAIAKYRAIKQGMTQDLFTRGIDLQTGQLRPAYKDAPQLYKETKLGWIPTEWEVLRLDEVAEIVSGGTPSTDKAQFWDGEILWASPTDITKTTGNLLRNTEKKITELGLRNSSAKMLPKGSLLMTSRATLCAIKVADEEITTNQGFKSLIVNVKNCNWFYYYYMSSQKERYSRYGIGTTFLEVNKKDTDAFLVKKPNIKEQEEIAARLNKVDGIIEKEQANLAKHQSLKKGLMQDLLTGKVEVQV